MRFCTVVARGDASSYTNALLTAEEDANAGSRSC